MIDTFNRRRRKETWKSISFTPNSCDAFNSYLKYYGSFIEVKHIGEQKYYHTFEKIYKIDLETEYQFIPKLLIKNKLN